MKIGESQDERAKRDCFLAKPDLRPQSFYLFSCAKTKPSTRRFNLKRENCRIFMWDGWIRRRVVWYLQKKKVTKWQAKRSGECLRCGKCCGQCPALDTEKKVCRIYGIRPAICKAFPLTPDDLKNLKCGFRFKK
jgi:hypothetical protein